MLKPMWVLCGLFVAWWEFFFHPGVGHKDRDQTPQQVTLIHQVISLRLMWPMDRRPEGWVTGGICGGRSAARTDPAGKSNPQSHGLPSLTELEMHEQAKEICAHWLRDIKITWTNNEWGSIAFVFILIWWRVRKLTEYVKGNHERLNFDSGDCVDKCIITMVAWWIFFQKSTEHMQSVHTVPPHIPHLKPTWLKCNVNIFPPLTWLWPLSLLGWLLHGLKIQSINQSSESRINCSCSKSQSIHIYSAWLHSGQPDHMFNVQNACVVYTDFVL